jgi:ferrochelatase
MSERWGVLLMAYGSPEKIDDVAAYFTHIRGGRPPSPEAVEDLKERYRRIGGRSPLFEITYRQARALEDHLNDSEERWRVYVGMRHAPPFIRETIAQMKNDGVQRAVGLALAPHYSRMSVGAYIEAAQQALREIQSSIQIGFVESWHLHSLFLKALSERVRLGLERFSPQERRQLIVVFTAHSLPERILSWNDPYPRQLLETSQAVAERVGLTQWRFAYQSAGHTPEPWLGPDLLDILKELGDEGDKTLLVCPVGFVADHLEVLYDIDLEARRRAEELGIHLERTESLNDDPQFVAALTAIVREHSHIL